MPQISIDQIKDTATKALIAHGAQDWIAAAVADATGEAEAHGNIICGLYYLESYCTQLASGRVKGDVMPTVHQPRPASVLVDAGYGFAQPAFQSGLPAAVSAARHNGVATLSVAHAHTCTSLGYFTEQIARSGLIALGFTNASPIVAGPGGKARVIGTNPIAFSVPDGDGGMALHFDCSTSAVALGKITMAKAAGDAIPLGWAVDKDGVPTTDPAAAIDGALVSAGDYKGWGFGLMVEILAAGMTGSVNSLDVGGLKLPDGPPHGLGQFYILMDPATHHDHFADRLARVVDSIAADDGARVPGQSRNRMDAVSVDDAFWDKVEALTQPGL
ncbi:MAG: Ldh family oxidoreductase [Pseudomonadota bacterium]